ncbi:MAG TPA: hypothetical protein VFV02_11695, partial [Acidimicrobiales bacterium]|nr:hypothetical protein [Acidimicrobiales bacterium]
MSRGNAQMPPARRRAIPGMIGARTTASPEPAERPPHRVGETGLAPGEQAPASRHDEPSSGSLGPRAAAAVNAPKVPAVGARHRRAAPSSTSAASVTR